MRFAPRQRIEGSYSGRHRSRQRGGSAEFVDYREYAPGEDLRRVDWKVLGRTARMYVRLFQDETNLRCTLLLDTSRSMAFAGESQDPRQSKLAYVQYLATAMSHVIASQRDQVGLALMSKGLVEMVTPGGTPSHVWRLQETIAKLEGRLTAQSELAAALRELFERLTRRGVLIIMSDFLVDDLDSVFANIRLFRHRRWEVIVLHVVHPQEERLPVGLAYRFQGMEDDGQVDCSPRDIASAYERAFENHAAAVRAQSLAAGCDYRRVSTGISYLKTLSDFLVERTG